MRTFMRPLQVRCNDAALFQCALSSLLLGVHVTIAIMNRCGEVSSIIEIFRGPSTINSTSVRNSSYHYILLIPLHQTFAVHTTQKAHVVI